MTKVVLDMIAFGLEHVVVFVFHFPSTTARLPKLGNVVIADLVVGDKAVMIELFARFGVYLGDLKRSYSVL